MKELRNTDLFGGDGKLLGYRTDDGVLHVTPRYDKNQVIGLTIKTEGTSKHIFVRTDRLDELLKILLTMRKELTSGRS